MHEARSHSLCLVARSGFHTKCMTALPDGLSLSLSRRVLEFGVGDASADPADPTGVSCEFLLLVHYRL